jgi:membrane fusion protein (multidrug efflux system)
VHRLFVSGVAGAVLVAGVACSRSGADAASAATVAPAGAKSATAGKADAKAGARDSTPRTGGPGGGAPRTASIVLGATDVAKVAKGKIEAGLPISGDLRPIETVTVRSRIDGVLSGVLVREGQPVSLGAVLARFESTEQESAMRSAEADELASKSDYDTQQWNYEQSKELFKVGAIAERDLRAAQQTADAARARLAAASARLKTAANVVRDTKVVAPFTGTVASRKVQNGENTQRGAEMFTLVRNDVLELTAALPARRAGEVHVGQPVRFMADSRQFSGTVARVSPVIDPVSRSITVYIQIPNPKGELKGNTFSSGQIIAQTLNDVLVIPQTGVRNGQGDNAKPFVYRIAGGELSVVPVQLGVVDDARGLVEVRDGLNEQDEIVIGNPGTLGRGMKAQVIGNEARKGAPGGPEAKEGRSGGKSRKPAP